MTPQQKELYRENLLAQLDGARIPVHASALLVGLRCGGFTKTDEPEMARELEYLIEKGLVRLERSEISRGSRHYKITAAGIDYMEANA